MWRKKEIKKQLLTDINFRLEQGESLPDVMSQMGSAKEIAEGFNENLTETEKKKYVQAKTVKIAVLIFMILALVLTAVLIFVHLLVPRGIDIEQSENFDKAQIEQAVKNTIELFDNKDYAALQANATEEMRPHLTEDQMESAKAQLAKDWGKRQFIGTVYMAEVSQKGNYAVSEVNVTYENVSVVYTLSYDTDMRLAGLYMR